MSARLLVSVGTDGYTDWVRLPNGQKLNLGVVSVAHFVANLTGGRSARKALDTFLKEGEAMVHVDEDLMWEMLAPHRTRWSTGTEGPFMPFESRTVRSTPMANLNTRLAFLNQHIERLNKAAAAGVPASRMAEGCEFLTKLAKSIRAEDQQQGEEKDEQEGQSKQAQQQAQDDDEPKEDKEQQAKEATLTFDTYLANTEKAQGIIACAEETVEKIDRLVEAGRKFNASKAKADVHAVTSKVASILSDADLTQSWVKGDLDKLAARAEHIKGLFASAKV